MPTPIGKIRVVVDAWRLDHDPDHAMMEVAKIVDAEPALPPRPLEEKVLVCLRSGVTHVDHLRRHLPGASAADGAPVVRHLNAMAKSAVARMLAAIEAGEVHEDDIDRVLEHQATAGWARLETHAQVTLPAMVEEMKGGLLDLGVPLRGVPLPPGVEPAPTIEALEYEDAEGEVVGGTRKVQTSAASGVRVRFADGTRGWFTRGSGPEASVLRRWAEARALLRRWAEAQVASCYDHSDAESGACDAALRHLGLAVDWSGDEPKLVGASPGSAPEQAQPAADDTDCDGADDRIPCSACNGTGIAPKGPASMAIGGGPDFGCGVCGGAGSRPAAAGPDRADGYALHVERIEEVAPLIERTVWRLGAYASTDQSHAHLHKGDRVLVKVPRPTLLPYTATVVRMDRTRGGSPCVVVEGQPEGRMPYVEVEYVTKLDGTEYVTKLDEDVPGLADAVVDVRQFMERGQPDHLAGTVQPIRGVAPGTTARAIVEGVATTCKVHADRLHDHGHGQPECLSLSMLAEELGEIAQALVDGDVAAYADGLVDLIYIAIGAGLRAGIPLDEVWAEVHRANLSKYPDCPKCKGTGFVTIHVSQVASFFSGYDTDPEVKCQDCDGRGFLVYRDAAGKVIKPPGFQPPNIAAIIERARRPA